MPTRARSPAIKNAQSHYPPADMATFRDLLLFEERLKRNAGLLKRRKRRYQFYLAVLVSTILVLSSDVLLETELFILPLNTSLSYYYMYGRPYYQLYLGPYLKSEAPAHDPDDSNEDQEALYDYYPINRYSTEQRYLHGFHEPGDYNANYPLPATPAMGDDKYLHLPQYIKNSLLFILGMTLFLFFASGMYSEKVGYANKYVPHANKALRQFNMYLNVRTQPLPSRLSRMASKIGLSFLFPSMQQPSQNSLQAPSSPPPQRMRTRSLSPSFSSRESSPFPTNESSNTSGWGEVNPIIPQIPPSSNPRGELIFSSRVHAAFREGYERYRDNYERRRQGGALAQDGKAASGKVGIAKSILYRLKYPFGFGTSVESSVSSTPAGVDTPNTEAPHGSSQYGFPSTAGGVGPSPLGSGGSVRGRTSSTTPSGSRKSSPAPPGSIGKKGSKRRAGGKISRQGTPLLEIVEVMGATSGAGKGDRTGGMLVTATETTSPVSTGSGGIEPLETTSLESVSSTNLPIYRRRSARGKREPASVLE